jgi:hypothetical protein
MDFDNTLLIDAPIREVFGYLARLENLPEWNYALRRTEQTSPGPVGVGSTFRQTRTLPRPAEETFRVTRFEPPSLLTVDGDFGPFRGTVTYELTAVGSHTTRLANTAHLNIPGALKVLTGLAGPRIKHEVAQNLHVLKTIIESRSASDVFSADGAPRLPV